MRQHILSEIKRITVENGGTPPGQDAFRAETGIADHKWRGVFWARWSDAVREVGFEPREFGERYDSGELLRSFARIALDRGRIPTDAELKLMRQEDAEIPSPRTLRTHFSGRGTLLEALRDLARNEPSFSGLFSIIPDTEDKLRCPFESKKDGWVYLIRSGLFFKIGRSNEIERRIKEIVVALPDKAELIHAISTDDPAGIESYWHKRFSDRRANGEWFRLATQDVKAFQRRRFQ